MLGGDGQLQKGLEDDRCKQGDGEGFDVNLVGELVEQAEYDKVDQRACEEQDEQALPIGRQRRFDRQEIMAAERRELPKPQHNYLPEPE